MPSVSPSSSQVHGVVAALGQPLSVFPSVGLRGGGTQVSVSADFLHFDTQDTVVCLRGHGGEVRIPAMCVCPDTLASATPTSMDRRVVFQTPPMAPPLPLEPSSNESEAVEPREAVSEHYHEVEVLVSLDGEHFTETGPRFTFCEAPEVLGASPESVQPGDKVSLSVEKLVPSTSACVKLVVSGDKDLSVVSRGVMVVLLGVRRALLTRLFVCSSQPGRASASRGGDKNGAVRVPRASAAAGGAGRGALLSERPGLPDAGACRRPGRQPRHVGVDTRATESLRPLPTNDAKRQRRWTARYAGVNARLATADGRVFAFGTINAAPRGARVQ